MTIEISSVKLKRGLLKNLFERLVFELNTIYPTNQVNSLCNNRHVCNKSGKVYSPTTTTIAESGIYGYLKINEFATQTQKDIIADNFNFSIIIDYLPAASIKDSFPY